MRKEIFVTVLVVSALVLTSRAEAQWRPERPYRGLFAGGLGETSQLLTATASVGAGWDQNLMPELVESSTLRSGLSPKFDSFVSTGSAQLSYALNTDSVGFGATAGTTGRYYPNLSSNRFLLDKSEVPFRQPTAVEIHRQDWRPRLMEVVKESGLNLRPIVNRHSSALRTQFYSLE